MFILSFLDLKPKISGSKITYNTLFIGKTVFILCAYDDCNSPANVTWYKVIIKPRKLFL